MTRKTNWARAKSYDRNARDAAEPCVICGRHTTGSLYVVMTDGGSSLVHPDDAAQEERENQAAYMGAFSIGPDCARRFGDFVGTSPAEWFGRTAAEVEGSR